MLNKVFKEYPLRGQVWVDSVMLYDKILERE
jgi:hypothetical protein